MWTVQQRGYSIPLFIWLNNLSLKAHVLDLILLEQQKMLSLAIVMKNYLIEALTMGCLLDYPHLLAKYPCVNTIWLYVHAVEYTLFMLRYD